MFKIRAVLSDEVYDEISLEEMFAVDVHDKKKISVLVRELCGLYPISELSHLKRVRSTDGIIQVLISPTNSETIESFTQQLRPRIDFTGLGSVSIVQVCRTKPITRVQFVAATKFWPTNFHENKRLEKALGGELFSEEEASLIKTFMDAAGSKNGADELLGTADGGAVVVDPLTHTIVAQGVSDSVHPLKHAVMVAIDNVAVQQGGGAWNQGKASLLQGHLSDSGLIPAKEEEINSQDVEMPTAKRLKKSAQYLCTGYDLYTVKEPCVMCSMALVHSRIGRVFYSQNNNKDGGLGSKYKIHLQEGLNHHFEVYNTLS